MQIFIPFSFVRKISGVVAPVVAGMGYWMGTYAGGNTAKSLNFVTDTALTTLAVVTTQKAFGGGTDSATAGYVHGGLTLVDDGSGTGSYNGTTENTILRHLFATNVRATLAAVMPDGGRGKLNAVDSSTKGYMLGGSGNGSFGTSGEPWVMVIDGLTFATEVAFNPAAVLSNQGVYSQGYAFYSSNYGYCFCITAAPTAGMNNRLDFANDTIAALGAFATMPNASAIIGISDYESQQFDKGFCLSTRQVSGSQPLYLSNYTFSTGTYAQTLSTNNISVGGAAKGVGFASVTSGYFMGFVSGTPWVQKHNIAAGSISLNTINSGMVPSFAGFSRLS